MIQFSRERKGVLDQGASLSSRSSMETDYGHGALPALTRQASQLPGHCSSQDMANQCDN
jgi:hypothetical protein